MARIMAIVSHIVWPRLATVDWRRRLALWRRRHRSRIALRYLDARELDDIGLTEAERARECKKWFWQE
jgi:uncharacterized protein YjiS (DUF1127 family)